MASLAGTWGSEIKNEMENDVANHDSDMYQTVAKGSYSLESCTQDRSYLDNKYFKFKSIQADGLAVLQYSPGNIAQKPASQSVQVKAPSLDRSRSRLLRESDAPIAVGRSGIRIEHGISASGLSGEKLNTSEELAKNSYVQRTWLGYDDPSLTYKTNGIPIAATTTELSLNIGINDDGSEKKYEGANFRRTACITSPSKTSMFADEY